MKIMKEKAIMKQVNDINNIEFITEEQFNKVMKDTPNHGQICNTQDRKFKFIYSDNDIKEMYIVDFYLDTCNPCFIEDGKLYVNKDVNRYNDMFENWYDEIVIDNKSFVMQQMMLRSEYDEMVNR